MTDQHLLPMRELLALEPVERDLFRGRNEIPDNGHPNIFGGQIAAQGLKAAGMTVKPDRPPHSFHGYFLRPGRRIDPVIFKVERDRDGRSFSARRVRAIQDGRVIFDLTASFHVDETGPELAPERPDSLPDPADCATEPFNHNFPAVEARMVVPAEREPQPPSGSPTLWVRSTDRLETPLDHACVLAYVSDISSGFVGSPVRRSGGGASIDHAMWFQQPVRADDWLLVHMWPVLAGGARGLYQGSIHQHDGVAAALFTQQCLLRAPARRDH